MGTTISLAFEGTSNTPPSTGYRLSRPPSKIHSWYWRSFGSLAARPDRWMKPRCVTGSHTTSPLTPAAAGSLVAPKVIFSDSELAISAARSSSGVGGTTGFATGGSTTTATGGAGGERFHASTASTKHAAAANHP